MKDACSTGVVRLFLRYLVEYSLWLRRNGCRFFGANDSDWRRCEPMISDAIYKLQDWGNRLGFIA